MEFPGEQMTDLINAMTGSRIDGLKVIIFLMGIVTMLVMGVAFRKGVRGRPPGRGWLPVTLTILLAQVLFTHTILSLLIFRDGTDIRLTEIEIFALMGLAVATSALTFWMSAQVHRPMMMRAAGAVMSLLYVTGAFAATYMALPTGTVNIEILPAILTTVLVTGGTGYVMWSLIVRGKIASAVTGMALITVMFTLAQLSIASNVKITFDDLSQFTHEGKDALWLEVFSALLSVGGLGLCAVMGDNPRQHWRRYAVTAFLVSVMSGSIFVAMDQSLRYANAHFELSRLVEVLNSQRSSLYVKTIQFEDSSNVGTMRRTVPSDVFRGMQTYFDTSIEIDELITGGRMNGLIRDSYLAETGATGDSNAQSLKTEIRNFYEYLKSSFGLQMTEVPLSDLDQAMFERRLNNFSNLIIAQARNASEIQILVKEMVLFGGLLIVAFLTFGVFLPAHRSTIQALDALESEKARIYKLALCAEHTTKGIVLTNGRGQITWCNDAFCDMTGFRFSDLEGKTLLQATRNPKADQDVLDRAFEDLRAMRPTDIEVLACRKDKSDFWMSGSITPVSENGRVRQVVHVFNDVTEEREMRDRLSAAQHEAERLALIARHASDGMAILERDYQIGWINPSLERMTGYSLEELRRSPLHEVLVGAESNREDLADLLATLGAREPAHGEFLCYRKDGQKYWIEAIHTPFFDDDGRFAGYVIIHRDISERKELQLELIASRDDLAARVEERTQTITNQAFELEKALAAERELNRMQTEFVSMASHEFRTPLTIIDGAARRLEKRADRWTPQEIVEKAQSIRSTVKRMTMLVERTLDASRLSSGRIKLTPEEFDARELVTEVCQRQREVAPTHTIQCDLANYPEMLFGDARLMDNVFTNIISNAVKYSGESKSVQITGSTADGYAVLKVRDHGIGIPKDELPKIFQRFFRASTSTGIPGTGIGLNLVKSLVDMHYGKVKLDSVEGEWTEFSIYMPLESPLETGVLLEGGTGYDASDDEQSVA